MRLGYRLFAEMYPKRQNVAPLVLESHVYINGYEISPENHSLDFTCLYL